MPTLVLPGAGFLVAVLWFDLMFDVQTRKHVADPLPEDVLASISAYYWRVTTDARPMNFLVSGVMGFTLLAIAFEIVRGEQPWWIGWGSLVATLSAVGLALTRTVRNAVRLGLSNDTVNVRTRLARTIYGDHVYCLAAMALVVGLQLSAGC